MGMSDLTFFSYMLLYFKRFEQSIKEEPEYVKGKACNEEVQENCRRK